MNNLLSLGRLGDSQEIIHLSGLKRVLRHKKDGAVFLDIAGGLSDIGIVLKRDFPELKVVMLDPVYDVGKGNLKKVIEKLKKDVISHIKRIINDAFVVTVNASKSVKIPQYDLFKNEINKKGGRVLESLFTSNVAIRNFSNHFRDISLIAGKSSKIPIASGSVDVAFSSCFMYHIFEEYPEDFIETLKEIHRVLKPNGKIIVVDYVNSDLFCFLSRRGKIKRKGNTFCLELNKKELSKLILEIPIEMEIFRTIFLGLSSLFEKILEMPNNKD